MNDPGALSLSTGARIGSQSTIWSLCIFGSLVILSGLSCILGTFYDDEIYSIRQNGLPFANLWDYVNHVNSHDVHPPISYVLNRLSFAVLGNWKAVKFVNGTISATAIAWFYSRTAERFSEGERIAIALALATAVTSLMWTASLRWSAYFNPAFLGLYVVALSPRLSITVRAAILTFGTVFLLYTAYLAPVAAAVLWGTFFAVSFRDLRRDDIVRITAMVVAGAIACLPQLYVLFTVHLPIYVGQGNSFSIARAFAESAYALTVGTAIFPIDYVPLLFMLLLAIAGAASAKRMMRDRKIAVLLGGALVGFVLLVLSAIGVQGRTGIAFYPIALTLIVVAICRSPSWIRIPAGALLVLLQTMSVHNFVLHHDTVKGSFNTPFMQATRVIATLSRACAGKSYVFTHDPVLTYLLQEAGRTVSSPYADSDSRTLSLREKDCVVLVVTYRGVLPHEWYSEHMKPLATENFHQNRTIYLGPDRFHTTKSLIANDSFPMYYITIGSYEVLHDTSISSW
jgi:hypothetical protein